MPNSTDDVSFGLVNLAQLRYQSAVWGGGHMFWPGLANVAAGVAIDLSSITNVTVSPDRKTTSAGGDARWGAIYSQLDARNLSIVGGRVFDIGIGGFALGGMRIVRFV